MSGRKQYWTDHLKQIAAEGVPVRAYARREGLSAAALYYWRKRLKSEANPVAPDAAEIAAGRCLVPIQITADRSPSPCPLTLAPGIHLALAERPSPEWLARVVAAQSAGER